MREFTVIENKTKTDEKVEKKQIRQTNPISKKFLKFRNEKEKFKITDLFK